MPLFVNIARIIIIISTKFYEWNACESFYKQMSADLRNGYMYSTSGAELQAIISVPLL